MNSPKLTKKDRHLLLELPTRSLKRHEVESWIVKVLAECNHSSQDRILVWRKDPTMLHIKRENIDRFIHLIDSLKPPTLRIALAFPADYYNEELDQMAMKALARGIRLEVFFDVGMAEKWLLDEQ